MDEATSSQNHDLSFTDGDNTNPPASQLADHQKDTVSTAEPLLTPIKSRGKRSTKAKDGAKTLKKRKTEGEAFEDADLKRVEQAVSSAAGSSMAEHRAALLKGRLGTLRSADKLKGSRLLEVLPYEILERIFMYADSLDFPRASPLLGRAFSSPALLKEFTMRRFALTWDCYHGRIQLPDKIEGHKELKTSEDGKIQGKLEAEVMSQKWFNLDIFVGALELWHRSRKMTHFYTCWHSRPRSTSSPDLSLDEGDHIDMGYQFECTCPKPLSVEACVTSMWGQFTGYVQRGCGGMWLDDLRSSGFNLNELGAQKLFEMDSDRGIEFALCPEQFGNKQRLFSTRYSLAKLPPKYQKFLWYPSFRCIDGLNHCVVPDHIIDGPWPRQNLPLYKYAQQNTYVAEPDLKIEEQTPPAPLPAPSFTPLASQDDVSRLKLMFMLTMPDFEVLDDHEREGSNTEPQSELFKKHIMPFLDKPSKMMTMDMAKSKLLPIEAVVCLLSTLQLHLWSPGEPEGLEEFFQQGSEVLRAMMEHRRDQRRKVTWLADEIWMMLEAIGRSLMTARFCDMNDRDWFVMWLMPRHFPEDD